MTQKRDDLFFTQDGHIIPSRIQPSITRETYPYSLASSIGAFPLEQSWLLLDDISETAIEIDPLMAPWWFSLVLDFGSVLEKNTFFPVWDIVSNTSYTVEISKDGTTYVQIDRSDMSNYTFRYIRLSFPEWKTTQSSTFLRTLRFDKKTPTIYILSLKSLSPIEAYRGWICESSRLFSLENERWDSTPRSPIETMVQNPLPLTFSPLPTTGKDSDGDTIIDMRDNCITESNQDQADRNYDGIGNACSDDDGDGIAGKSDNCPTISNTEQKDLNANNVGDACEFDSDSDTIADGADNCRQNANTHQRDTDSDGVGDACDNCRIFNPDQRDLDMNTIGDTCTIQEEYEKIHDSDTDGILDFSDNCRKTANQDQRDTDSDGIGDACDNCLSIQNTDQWDGNKNGIWEMCEDSDSDTIIGWRDNCIDRANPDQKDGNNNGVGNACEDTDRDSIVDALDNCPWVWNQDQRDTDDDHIGNICDEKDDRMIESNRTLFMVIFGMIALIFIAGIIYFMRKISL